MQTGSDSLNIEVLFSVIANPKPTLEQGLLLRQLVPEITWDNLNRVIAHHRMGSLLYWHLDRLDLDIPVEIHRTLTGIFLQRKHQAEINAKLSADMTFELQQAGIESVCLKGSALAHLAYLDPALRPMDDIDILVDETAIGEAAKVLRGMGINVPPPKTRSEKLNHHWPIATTTRNASLQFVELHRGVHHTRLGARPRLNELKRPFKVIDCAGNSTIYSMHPEELLITQIQRLSHLTEIYRGILISDIVGLAEFQVESINWELLLKKKPSIRGTFRAIREFTPISPELNRAIGIVGKKPIVGISIGAGAYGGWPVNEISRRMSQPMAPLNLLRETFIPNSRWARLAYGAERGFWGQMSAALVKHPVNIAMQGFRRLYYGAPGIKTPIRKSCQDGRS
jgi:hypothetical protein